MPNALVLMSDQHAPSYSSVHGHPTIHTPNLDRLAQRGVVFESACCPCPLCLPSRSAFMSGLRTHQTQTYGNCTIGFGQGHPSYGAILAEQGVFTAHFGQVDVYAPGHALGFSMLCLGVDRPTPGDLEPQRHEMDVQPRAELDSPQFGPSEDFRHIWKDRRVIDAAVDWLLTEAPHLDRPWTATVNVLNPHHPLLAPRRLWDLYPEVDMPAMGAECDTAQHPYAQDLRHYFHADAVSEKQTRGLRRGYLACVTYVDLLLGLLLDALEASGQADHTDVIYTSDHGEMLGKFGMWWKSCLYEDSVRVPVVAAGPGFEAGARVKTPVGLHDVQAALFSATGAKRPEAWCGRPLQSIQQNDLDRVVFSEYQGPGTRAGAYMIRKGDWKLIYCVSAPHQLFNLAEDPDELNNAWSAHPEKAAELEAELRRLCDPEEEDRRADSMQSRQAEIIGEHPEWRAAWEEEIHRLEHMTSDEL